MRVPDLAVRAAGARLVCWLAGVPVGPFTGCMFAYPCTCSGRCAVYVGDDR